MFHINAKVTVQFINYENLRKIVLIFFFFFIFVNVLRKMQKIYEFYTDLIESNNNGKLSKLETLSANKTLWDLIVITAISNDQKKCYELQIKSKQNANKLPKSFRFQIINDPDNCKIGSGGSTLNVIKQLFLIYGSELFSMKILLIHAGGYSQRMPNCTVLGKIFSSIACESKYINDFLDIKLAIYTPFSIGMQPGIFLASSDDIITCDLDEQIEASYLFGLNNNDFILLAHKSSLQIGKDHGVYAVDLVSNTNTNKFNVFDCKFVLQKPSIDKMLQMKHNGGLIQNDNTVFSDSLFYFSHNISKLLLDLHDKYFDRICLNKIEIDAYRDFLQPLGSEPISLDDYLKSITSINNKDIFEYLYSIFKMHNSLVINLTNSIFYHLGTINELLDFYLNTNETNACQFRENICFKRLKLKNNDNNHSQSNLNGCVQNSHINPLVKTSSLSLLEYSFIDDDIELILNDYCFLNNCMLKKSELNNINNNDQLRFEIPANICMHTISIKLNDQLEEYVTIFFNKNDDLKKNYNNLNEIIFMNKILPERLAGCLKLTNESNTIWNLKIFQSANTMSESFVKSLNFINKYNNELWNDDLMPELKLFSLFDLLKLQNYENMISFRTEHGLL